MKLKWGWNRTLFLPVVAVALLMVQAEWNASIGTVYSPGIRLPRDLVYGQYLQIQYELGSLGVSQTELLETHMVCLHVEEGELTSHGLPRAWRTSPVRPAYLRRTSWVQSATWFRADARELEASCKTRNAGVCGSDCSGERGRIHGDVVSGRSPWRSVLDESNRGLQTPKSNGSKALETNRGVQ